MCLEETNAITWMAVIVRHGKWILNKFVLVIGKYKNFNAFYTDTDPFYMHKKNRFISEEENW